MPHPKNPLEGSRRTSKEERKALLQQRLQNKLITLKLSTLCKLVINNAQKESEKKQEKVQQRLSDLKKNHVF